MSTEEKPKRYILPTKKPPPTSVNSTTTFRPELRTGKQSDDAVEILTCCEPSEARSCWAFQGSKQTSPVFDLPPSPNHGNWSDVRRCHVVGLHGGCRGDCGSLPAWMSTNNTPHALAGGVAQWLECRSLTGEHKTPAQHEQQTSNHGTSHRHSLPHSLLSGAEICLPSTKKLFQFLLQLFWIHCMKIPLQINCVCYSILL